ncbi:RHS repeat protein, partial [Methylobacter sp. BlB1]|nr:RHS repeat protein [Methylobacter sp. BlB1]
MTESLGYVTQFRKHLAKNLLERGKEAVEGAADLGQAGYSLATDPAYREQTFEAAKEIARHTDGIGHAIDDPTGTLNGIKNDASAAWDTFKAARAQAAAEGSLAEFDAQAASYVLTGAAPGGQLGRVGKTGELLAKTAKLDKAEDLASAEKRAAQAIQAGQALPNQAPRSKVLCPLGKLDKPAAKKTSPKTGKSAAGKP